jgi:hypothetical protein
MRKRTDSDPGIETRIIDEIRDIKKFYPEITPAIADRCHLILLGEEPYGREADAVLEARRNQRVMEDISVRRAAGVLFPEDMDALVAAQAFRYAAANEAWRIRLERRKKGG